MKNSIRNVLVAPIVILVRSPLMLIFLSISIIGKIIVKKADQAADWVHIHVPGWIW